MFLPSTTSRRGNFFVIKYDFEADSLCKVCFVACCPKKILCLRLVLWQQENLSVQWIFHAPLSL